MKEKAESKALIVRFQQEETGKCDKFANGYLPIAPAPKVVMMKYVLLHLNDETEDAETLM